MKIPTLWLLSLIVPCLALAQNPAGGIVGTVDYTGQAAPRIAVPDLPGFVGTDVLRTFNATLWNDLEAAGTLEMVAKSFYPRSAPTKPEEVKFGSDQLPPDPGARGPWLMGWSEPPVTARYLVFGQLEAQ
ncbi:MAG: hypothetical protein R2748_10635 [Bryobacterales bacterium]